MVSVAAIIGGLAIGQGLNLLVLEAFVFIHSLVATDAPLPPFTAEFARAVGFVFAGFAAATFARSSKIGHAIAVGVGAWLWEGLAWLQTPSLLAAIPWVLPIPGAWLGGLLERKATATLRERHPQREWEYRTTSGQSIRALAPWNFPVAARIWQAAGIALVTQAIMFTVAPFAMVLFEMMKLAGILDPIAVAYLLLVILLGVISSLSPGLACWWIARRMTAPSVDESLARDPRPPVVFLRPFDDDGKQLEGEGLWYELRHSLRALFQKSKEQRLEKILKKVGPLVAIGRPGEELAELGAARMYVSDADWQTVVEDFLKRAGLVVLQAGQSPGLKWEINKAVASVAPAQVLLFLPFRLVGRKRREKMYQAFLSWAQSCFPSPFPEKLDRSFFISFQDSPPWEARPLMRRSKQDVSTPFGRVLQDFSCDRTFQGRPWWEIPCLLAVIAAVAILMVFLTNP